MSCISKWKSWRQNLVPNILRLIDGLQDMDPESEDGKEITSTLEALDKLCAK